MLKKSIFIEKFKLLSRAREFDKSAYRVHIMAAHTPEYIYLAATCVWSFLRFNQAPNFVLYITPNLEKLARRKFNKLIREKILTISVIKAERSNWQNTKLSLILSLNGTFDMFMDADLRWNGPLPPLFKVTAYLEEFPLDKRHLAPSISKLLISSKPCNMSNLSFFTFCGKAIDEKTIQNTMNLQLAISSIALESNGSPELYSQVRLSEQIALSYYLAQSDFEVSYLKSSDNRNDGQFVESCYFGATGLTF